MTNPNVYIQAARRRAKQYGLDPDIFQRQIKAESNFNPRAGSGAGAVGIAQIMPATAKSWGIDPTNSSQALDAAAKHMAEYVKKYGSYADALRAYNAGAGAIEASHGYGETNDYVHKILFNGRDPGKLNAASAGDTGSNPAISGTRQRTSSSIVNPVTSGTSQDAAESPFQMLIDSLNPQRGSGESPADSIAKTAAALVAQREAGKSASSNTGVTSLFGTSAPATPKPVATPAPKTAGKVNVASGANRAGVTLQKPVLNFLDSLSASMGRPVDITTGTNHNQYVAGSNRESDHWTGNATDLGMGGDARQSAAVRKKGDLVAAHAIAIAGKLKWGEALQMAQKGGVFNFQHDGHRVQILWKTMEGGNHYNHVHVGVR